MKKLIALFMIAMTLLTAAACGGNGSAEVVLVPDDILSPVAIYSMASNIAQNPDEYDGKTVQAEGCTVYSEESSTGYYIQISDSTVCCFVNIEFSLTDGIEVPEEDSYFQIFGTISTYKNDKGKSVVRFDGNKVLYEDELREIYGEE